MRLACCITLLLVLAPLHAATISSIDGFGTLQLTGDLEAYHDPPPGFGPAPPVTDIVANVEATALVSGAVRGGYLYVDVLANANGFGYGYLSVAGFICLFREPGGCAFSPASGAVFYDGEWRLPVTFGTPFEIQSTAGAPALPAYSGAGLSFSLTARELDGRADPILDPPADAPVPEPASVFLGLIGAVVCAWSGRRGRTRTCDP